MKNRKFAWLLVLLIVLFLIVFLTFSLRFFGVGSALGESLSNSIESVSEPYAPKESGLNTNCRDIRTPYDNHKSYCLATVVVPPAELETGNHQTFFLLPLESRVVVNWVDREDERYFVVFCEFGIEQCKYPIVGYVDKNKILLDIDVRK